LLTEVVNQWNIIVRCYHF